MHKRQKWNFKKVKKFNKTLDLLWFLIKYSPRVIFSWYLAEPSRCLRRMKCTLLPLTNLIYEDSLQLLYESYNVMGISSFLDNLKWVLQFLKVSNDLMPHRSYFCFVLFVSFVEQKHHNEVRNAIKMKIKKKYD